MWSWPADAASAGRVPAKQTKGKPNLLETLWEQTIKQTRRARTSWRVPYQLYLAGSPGEELSFR
ncbi:hypothetical protein QEV69_03420 [Trueperella pyogenes]|uniref:Transposase n=1 Tax=Trueperella pyogenes TaxID=1661 RepID=A0ABV3NC32_9ACTO|nr:hypothetical protein [Trueperella pyogenes]AWA43858.1 hypothetical protein DBV13_07470 [Trueperella pyogenes]MCI7689742.1 hypothetical protein [Trueperella pyogenes]